MTVWWMLYMVAASLPILAGSWLFARVLRAHGRPERGAWTIGLALAIALPAGLLVSTVAADRGPAADVVVSESTRVAAPAVLGVMPRVAAPTLSSAVQMPFWMLWAAGSLLMCGWLGASLVGIRRIRMNSRDAMMHGRPVRVSPEMGPAVVGFLNPVILLPEWVSQVPHDESRWIVRHEEEHLLAGDPMLLLFGQLTRVVMPWNPVVWILSSQLFRAIEIDCDRRVLRGCTNPVSYGETLLSAAMRQPDPIVRPVAAFALLSNDLEKRLQAMSLRSRAFGPTGILALIAGFSLTLATCGMPLPTDLDREDYAEDALAEADATPTSSAEVEMGDQTVVSSPQFTPYEVAPTITNMRAVREALAEEYPPMLRDAGIGGTVTVYFYIDPEGRVLETQVNRSSGHAQLDQAALSVASVMEFQPALNRNEPVAVWVSFPIAFQVR